MLLVSVDGPDVRFMHKPSDLISQTTQCSLTSHTNGRAYFLISMLHQKFVAHCMPLIHLFREKILTMAREFAQQNPKSVLIILVHKICQISIISRFLRCRNVAKIKVFIHNSPQLEHNVTASCVIY